MAIAFYTQNELGTMSKRMNDALFSQVTMATLRHQVEAHVARCLATSHPQNFFISIWTNSIAS
jgi:hypothetical protein